MKKKKMAKKMSWKSYYYIMKDQMSQYITIE